MDTLITDIDQITPAWISERLRSNDYLAAPEDVTSVRVESSSRDSTNLAAHLNVDYTVGVVGLPSRLFFKTGDADMSVNSEVHFHNDILAYVAVLRNSGLTMIMTPE